MMSLVGYIMMSLVGYIMLKQVISLTCDVLSYIYIVSLLNQAVINMHKTRFGEGRDEGGRYTPHPPPPPHPNPLTPGI